MLEVINALLAGAVGTIADLVTDVGEPGIAPVVLGGCHPLGLVLREMDVICHERVLL